jgi:hypothetical protein
VDVVYDALGSGKEVIGGGSLLTDGDWIWRGDVWLHVFRHHALLPDDFRVKAACLGYVIPSVEQKHLKVLRDEVRALRADRRK